MMNTKTSSFFAVTLPAAMLLLCVQNSMGDSATWLANPANNNWNNPFNWTSGGPPNGNSQTATFAGSTITGISVPGYVALHNMVFAGPSSFTFTPNAELHGLNF